MRRLAPPLLACIIVLGGQSALSIDTSSSATVDADSASQRDDRYRYKRSPLPSSSSLHASAEDMVYMDNGVVKVGIDKTRGGSIGFFGPSGSDTNLVNCHDMGREVQLSFYAGPAFYNPEGKCNKLFMNHEWPWNPIGAGDIKGNHGAVLSQSFGKTSGHIVTRPLQWACDNVPCECEFEQQITLGGPANTGVEVVATLHNHRSDKTVYPPRSQELPAVYSNGPYYRLVTSEAGQIKELMAGWNASNPFPWVPGAFTADENWAAMVDKSGFGMGVINYDTTNFIGGFSGAKGSGGPQDPATGYIAPVKSFAIPADTNYTFTFHLVLGNIDTIRAYAQQARPHM